VSSNELPLNGLRVIDMADIKGELAGRILADLGADVIRVEPPGGAASRRMAPFAPDGDTSLYFAFRNFNKRGITVDVTAAEGQAQLRGLLATADVWIESTKPGSLAPHGLDPREISAEFEHLLVLSISDFGQKGPYARFEATDEVIQAMSGHLAASGIPEKPPLLIPGAFAYDTAGVVGALAVLIGLVAKQRTGRGQHLDFSVLEAAIQLNTWQMANMQPTLDAGMEPPVVRSGTAVIYPLFKTADGFITMVILSPRQWSAMWEWLGRPEAFADEVWGQTLTRLMNGDVLNPVIAEHFAPMPMEEAAAEAQRRGVVVTPMLKPSDILVNEHYRSRSTFVPVEIAPGVTAEVASGFMEINRQRQGFRSGPPAVGEHSAELAEEAASAAVEAEATAATDVTGFGLLGHLQKLAAASGVGAVIQTDAVPVLTGAWDLLDRGFAPGGTTRNLEHVRPWIRGSDDQRTLTMLADAQTSGGLLFCCSPAAAFDAVARLKAAGHGAAVIGELSATNPGCLVVG